MSLELMLPKVVNRKNNPGNGTWATSYEVTGALCPSALRSCEGQGPESLSHLVGTRDLCKSDRVYSQIQPQLFTCAQGFSERCSMIVDRFTSVIFHVYTNAVAFFLPPDALSLQECAEHRGHHPFRRGGPLHHPAGLRNRLIVDRDTFLDVWM